MVGTRQVLGDLPADAAHLLAASLACTSGRGGARRRGRAARRSANVRLRQAAGRPRRSDRREVDAELLRDPANERRRLHLLARYRRSNCARLLGLGGPGAVPADHHEHGPDRDDVALGNEDPRHDTRGRRRDLDRRLVGLDLDEWLVLRDLVPLGHEPTGDLALGQALAEIRQLELILHGAGRYL